MPTATLVKIEPGKFTMKVEDPEGNEYEIVYPITKRVEEWVQKNKKDYPIPCVRDFIVADKGEDAGKIIKIDKSGTFVRASNKEVKYKKDAIDVVKPKVVEKVAPIIDAEKVQKEKECPKDLGVDTSNMVHVGTRVIGSFDPDKVHGYEISDTCQMIQYEPVTITVKCDDPETGRRALIDAWGMFGQHNEVVRDNVQKHIERSLMKGE